MDYKVNLPYQIVHGPVSARITRHNSFREYNCESYLQSKPVNTSLQMDNMLLDAIEPFDWSKLEQMRLEYVAGHKVKLQDLDESKTKARIEQEIVEDYYSVVERALETPQLHIQAQVARVMSQPAFLPVYVLKLGRLQAAVNGQTGRVAVTENKNRRNFWWVLEPLTIIALVALGMHLLFHSWLHTGLASFLAAIMTFVVLGESRGIVSKRIIKRGSNVSAKREGKKLKQGEKISDDSSIAKPVFFENIGGMMQPVQIKFFTPMRIAGIILFLFLFNNITILLANAISLIAWGELVPAEKYLYNAAWWALSIPCSLVFWMVIVRRDIFEHPVMFDLDGKRKKEDKTKGKAQKSRATKIEGKKNSLRRTGSHTSRDPAHPLPKSVLFGIAGFLLLMIVGAVGAMLT